MIGIWGMARVFRLGLTAQNMMGIGMTTKYLEMEDFFTPIKTAMKVNSKEEKHMVMVFIRCKVVKYMKASGKKISPTAKENKLWKMVLFTRVNSLMVPKMATGSTNGSTTHHILGSGKIICLTVKENTYGQTVGGIGACGKPTKCMVEVSLSSMTNLFTLVVLNMIKSMETGSKFGKMANNLKATGMKGVSMVRDS
jgi:hypothetical protein